MKISVIDGLIKSYAIVGDIEGSIEYEFESQDELLSFEENFEPDKYRLDDGKVLINNDFVDVSEERNLHTKKELEISDLKNQLAETDYIFIKVSEAGVVGANSPYDDDFLKEISDVRNEIRKRINELENVAN